MQQEYQIFTDDDDQFWVASPNGMIIIEGPFRQRSYAEDIRDDLNMKLWEMLERSALTT